MTVLGTLEKLLGLAGNRSWHSPGADGHRECAAGLLSAPGTWDKPHEGGECTESEGL